MKQYDLKVKKDVVEKFCELIKHRMTGRDAKNMAKLIKVYEGSGKEIDEKMMVMIAKFKDIDVASVNAEEPK